MSSNVYLLKPALLCLELRTWGRWQQSEASHLWLQAASAAQRPFFPAKYRNTCIYQIHLFGLRWIDCIHYITTLNCPTKAYCSNCSSSETKKNDFSLYLLFWHRYCLHKCRYYILHTFVPKTPLAGQEDKPQSNFLCITPWAVPAVCLCRHAFVLTCASLGSLRPRSRSRSVK